jgi:hypothetical protein
VAITFPITGVATTYSATRSPAFTLGTAPLEDDIIVVSISAGAVPQTATAPATWDSVLGATVDVESDQHCALMVYHRVTAAEAGASTVTWTLTNLWASTATGRVNADVLRGVATSGELVGGASGFSNTNTATPWVIPDVTPTGTCQIIALVSGDGTQTQTTPANWTIRTDNDGAAPNLNTYSRDALGSNGVPTGTTNVTPSGGDEYVSIVACFAPTAAPTTDAPAGLATVTSTANNPTTAGASIIGLATNTATAHNPAGSVGAKPGVAAVTATAHNPGTSGSSAVGQATATATANNPAPSVAVNTGAASITATAYNPTVSTASATNAPAGSAGITATAYNPTVSISVSVGVAAVTATANGPTVSIGAKPSAAAVTATAYNPAGSVDARPGVATVTGTAYAVGELVSVVAGVATVTGTAYDPTALTEGTVLGPYRIPIRWSEPSVERGDEPPTAVWQEPPPTVGSHQ